MTLVEFREWLKTQVECPQWYLNTVGAAERCIALYDNVGAPSRLAVGGLANTTYTTKVISILVKWGKDTNTAELKAKEVYDTMFGQTATVGGKRVVQFVMRHSEPLSVGKDSEGNQEYVIDVTINYER